MPTLTFHRAQNGHLAPCRATVRKCPKGEHIVLDEQQQAFLKETFGIIDLPTRPQVSSPTLAEFTTSTPAAEVVPGKLIEGLSFPPVVVRPTVLREPNLAAANFSFAHNYPDSTVAFEVADTYYDEVQIEDVHLPAVLAGIFGTEAKHIPAELTRSVVESKLALDRTGSWLLTRGGYYDDDYSFELYGAAEAQAQLSRWWFSQPNATDRNGVLAYCRAKGLDTTGLTPIEALRAQLAKENPGRTNQQVEAATGVEQRTLRFSQVEVLPARLAEIEARPVKKPAEVTEYLDPIVGVVYPVQQLNGEARYVMVDGYHRLKDRLGAKKRVGEFLVLTRQR